LNQILITNNPAARDAYEGRAEIIYLDNAGFMQVLHAARDKIHEGHKLLTHPLSGSVKPGQTPYKSIMLSQEQSALCVTSLTIIEDGIAIAKAQIERKKEPVWPDEVLEDFQMIDLSLISSGGA